MDALWSVQEATVNELVPWRVQLGDNDDGGGRDGAQPQEWCLQRAG